MSKSKKNCEKNKKPFNVLSKKGLLTLAMTGVMMAAPFGIAGCSNGKDGEPGAKGEPGTPGTIWKSGEDYTIDFTDAKVGDFFIDTNDYILYQKTGDGWKVVMENYGKPGSSESDSSEEELPEYWKTYLNGKIAEINTKAELYGANSDAFIFITDQHLDGTNDYSAAVINYITRNTSIKKVIFGGKRLYKRYLRKCL